MATWEAQVRPQLDAVPTGWYELEVIREDVHPCDRSRDQLVLTFRIDDKRYEGRLATAAVNIRSVITPLSKLALWGAVLVGEKKSYSSGDFVGKRCRGLVTTIKRGKKATMLRVLDIKRL